MTTLSRFAIFFTLLSTCKPGWSRESSANAVDTVSVYFSIVIPSGAMPADIAMDLTPRIGAVSFHTTGVKGKRYKGRPNYIPVDKKEGALYHNLDHHEAIDNGEPFVMMIRIWKKEKVIQTSYLQLFPKKEDTFYYGKSAKALVTITGIKISWWSVEDDR